MSFVKLQDGRSIYALDSIRLRSQREATAAPQANTIEVYVENGILYQIDEDGVKRELSVTPVVGRFYLPANQTVAPSTTAVVGLETADFQSSSLVSGTGTNTKIKVPLKGKYRISARIAIQPSGNVWNNASPQLILAVDNANTAILDQQYNITGSNGINLNGSTIVDLDPNSYVQIKFDRSTGTGNATIFGNIGHTYLDIERVGF